MRTLTRYLTSELVGWLSVVLLLLTMLLVLVVVAGEASRMNLGLGPTLKLLPFVLPTALAYALPCALLFTICLVYLIGTQFFDMPLWFGVRNISSAVFGLPIAFIVTIVVSLMTPAPSKGMQDLVDSVRIPRGEMPTLAAKSIQHDPAVRLG